MSVLAVYDCMLFFRAASRPERPSLLFQFVEERTVTLCLGGDVLAEIYDVLTRPEHQERFSSLTPQVVDTMVVPLGVSFPMDFPRFGGVHRRT